MKKQRGRDERARLGEHGFVTFRLDDQWLGLPVVLVQEVLTGQRVAPVPLSPPHVHGLLNLRGQIVTAVDMRAILGLPTRPADLSFINVVVSQDDELFSLIVDEVGDVLEVDEGGIEPTPITLDPVWKSCSQGVVRMDDCLMVLLDVDTVLGTGEEAAA